jgi:hypothetical protein
MQRQVQKNVTTFLFISLINTYSPHHSLLVFLVKIALWTLCMGCKIKWECASILQKNLTKSSIWWIHVYLKLFCEYKKRQQTWLPLGIEEHKLVKLDIAIQSNETWWTKVRLKDSRL